jgi:GDP-L-fucose synthase
MPTPSLHARIFVAGHRGMVGSAIVRELERRGYSEILTRSRGQLNLLDQAAVFDFLATQRPDYIFVAAAKVGGIHANNVYRADFLYENLAIQNNLIHGAHRAGIQRLCFLGSSCIYPRDCPQPIREDYLLTGPLEQTNEPYAIAKIAGVKLCESYNRQYGRQYIAAMPTNLYGPNDNYDLANSHVLPALIRKAHLGKLALAGDIAGIRLDAARYGDIPDDLLARLGCTCNAEGLLTQHAPAQPEMLVWGSGTPMREFLYVDDLAQACVFLMEQGYDGPLVNVGTGTDVTIRELAETVMDIVGFPGQLSFDASKPDGTKRKLLDVSRLAKSGWRASTILGEGIARAYSDYLAQGSCP